MCSWRRRVVDRNAFNYNEEVFNKSVFAAKEKRLRVMKRPSIALRS